ncbi:hypothetical protein ACFUOZ_05270 [Paenarthrobacter sp. NPDC057355]|uniref:hypothetical protein n=1 Tax=Paenarthrobacter sp. NPDC057355 TaxID=3346105 RepID=UPI0036457B1D
MTVAHRLGPGSLLIGATGSEKEFAVQTTKTTLTPSVAAEDDINTLDGNTLGGDETETWELTGTIHQSYDANSLLKYCFDNRYSKTKVALPFTFIPLDSGTQEWTGTIKLRALDIGGDVKKQNTSDFSFPLVGEPALGTNA